MVNRHALNHMGLQCPWRQFDENSFGLLQCGPAVAAGSGRGEFRLGQSTFYQQVYYNRGMLSSLAAFLLFFLTFPVTKIEYFPSYLTV